MGSKRQKVSNYNKEVRDLIRDCDEFITSIESDLALARRELKGSKCNKRSKQVGPTPESNAKVHDTS